MRIIEVFCCSGGLSEGFRRAGLPVSMAFDYDEDACDSHEANTGLRPIRVDVHDVLRMIGAGASLGPVDLFIADPPCTPWSRAGKRQGRDDDRDMIDATVAVIRAIRPVAWLIANVPGLDDGPNWPIVQETIGGLTRDGYCIDFSRLDAADYGVPQHRVRPFWYGHARGTPCIRWPARTHGGPSECGETLPGFDGLRPWVTCRQALGHLSPEDLGTPVRLRWRGCQGKQIASVPDRPARVVGTSNLSDGNVLAHADDAIRKVRRSQRDPGRKARASGIDEVASVVTTRQNGDGNTLVMGPNPHKPSSPSSPSRTMTRNAMGDGALIEWPWDRPATTVTSTDRLAPAGHHEASFLSGANAIKLSEKAAAILQGFPNGWVFAGATKKARWSQIGMAMPPPLGEAVARSIAAQLAASSPQKRKIA